MKTKESSDVSKFVFEQLNPANGQSPAQALAVAIQRLETVAYARGVADAVADMEMVAAVVPATVSKAKLLELVKNAIQQTLAHWENSIEK